MEFEAWQSWFASYLANRTQCGSIGNFMSNSVLITRGVPQGSILEPLLFILYINDIVTSSEFFKFIMFAGDVNLFLSNVNPELLVSNVNIELAKVSLWLKLNKLSLNVKTNCIIFHSRQWCVISDINISIDGVLIEKATHPTFLGVMLSEDLSCNEHLKILFSKVSTNFGVLRKLSYILPSYIIIKLYNALILPYTDYCNLVWSTHPSTLLDKL